MRPSIAIVDDDENVAQLLAFAFRRGGFEASVLRDGRAAVEHVAACAPPDAVVLDLMLPCRDGFEVARAIRADARWRAVRIVMLSARAGSADRERARTIGADAFLEKPFHPRALVDEVQRLLAAKAP